MVRRKQELDEILDDLALRWRRGDAAGIESLARAYPELDTVLRERWLQFVVDECARLDPTATVPPSPDSTPVHRTLGPRAPRWTSPSPAGPLPGRFGGFELLNEVGRGGMGVVYRARQLSPDRIVALKLMLQSPGTTRAELSRFQVEAEAAGRLGHPSIVPVYEVGEHDGQPYYTMKFVEGETLAHRLAAAPISCRQAVELLIPVCRAIEYAHQHGILHRDLKPSNILLDLEGRPHLTDFGLAKRMHSDEDLTQSGALLGTPSYMAPEQASGERGATTARTDVYGLGAILFEMITGRPPSGGPGALETVRKILEEDPPLPRALNPAVDRDLEMIVLKCLQKPPELRYASAEGLSDDLQAYLGHEPIAARSGKLRDVVARLFRETHHAAVLENWGLLWIWHGVILFLICMATNILSSAGDESKLHYLWLWAAGLGTWASVFWALRRRAGPVTFVERQIAHVWGGSILASMLLYAVEWLLSFPPLTLAPLLPLIAGMAFLAKAGILSGRFYVHSIVLFATALPMALSPDWGLTIFGTVCGLCFLLPGIKHYRLRLQKSRG